MDQCPPNAVVKIDACESRGTLSLELGISLLVFRVECMTLLNSLAGNLLVASYTEHTTVSSTRRGRDFTAEIYLDALCIKQASRLCLKSQTLTWTQSVPPAVAGGYEVESARFAKVFVNLIHYPPATAGGTDCVQAHFVTFEAKLGPTVLCRYED